MLSVCIDLDLRMQVAFRGQSKSFDKNWYNIEDILGMISQPDAIKGKKHYQVVDTWNEYGEKKQKMTQS